MVDWVNGDRAVADKDLIGGGLPHGCGVDLEGTGFGGSKPGGGAGGGVGHPGPTGECCARREHGWSDAVLVTPEAARWIVRKKMLSFVLIRCGAAACVMMRNGHVQSSSLNIYLV